MAGRFVIRCVGISPDVAPIGGLGGVCGFRGGENNDDDGGGGGGGVTVGLVPSTLTRFDGGSLVVSSLFTVSFGSWGVTTMTSSSSPSEE